jgi:PPK2 family polyphosphate:nucleotide phosphotransferase
MEGREYRLTVDGELSDSARRAFEGMTLTRAHGRTVLAGRVRDQAALHGLFRRTSDLGLTLLDVRVADDTRQHRPPAVESADAQETHMTTTTGERILEQLVVAPGTRAALAERDPGWTGGSDYEGLSHHDLKREAKAVLARDVERLSEAQELLWASDTRALLVVFQAMDAAGKDSAIEHVMSGVNPQGVQVFSFKQPSSEELDHDFLWRVARAAPERGRIGIFNRSHYEEVVALRVHPEWLAAQRLPSSPDETGFWDARYEDINTFERHLDRTGTKIVKFFLHVSKAEQKRRFIGRLDEPHKEWKFNAADVAERARWDDYMAAYDAALSATSTPWAPWHVIPADHKWLTQALVAAILVDTINALGLRWPEVSEAEHAANLAARAELEAEAADGHPVEMARG